MFRNTDTQQKMYFGSFNITDRKLKKIDKSWAAVFNKLIMPVLMKLEALFADFFDPSKGRPNFPVAVLLGIILLKHEFDLTDEETVDQFNFNILWHKALGTISYDCNICRKTIYNFQSQLNDSHRHLDIFNQTTVEIIGQSGIKIGRQRLDSVHIRSNMAQLGRFRLFCRTIEMFLEEYLHTHTRDSGRIPLGVFERYLDREGYFCDPKPSESRRKIGEAAEDMYRLITGFEADAEVNGTGSFQVMKRLFSEQCRVDEKEGIELIEKPSSDSIQNPSDPDAGYSGHKGKGYQAQVSESCGDDNPFEVVTSVKVESASESDAAAVAEVLEELDSNGLKPEEMQADTGYGSQENVEKAREMGVKLEAPVPGTRQSAKTNLDAFSFSEDSHQIVSCPHGVIPSSQRYRKKKDVGEADFDLKECEGCPLLDQCPGRILKNGIRRVKWKRKSGELAKRRQYQKTTVFKENYKKRSGIEATFSQFGNTHGGKHLKVRGFPAVHGAVMLKFTALNIHRFIRHVLSIKPSPSTPDTRAIISNFSRSITHFAVKFLPDKLWFSLGDLCFLLSAA